MSYRDGCLQVGAVLVVFLLLLVCIYRKRGRLPIHVEQRERLSRSSIILEKAKKPLVQTPESLALLQRLSNAVVALAPDKLSHLTFYESDDTRIDDKKVVYVCLRDPNTGTFYPWNSLIYVCIHEMAHAISEGYDPMHTSSEFQSNFWHLLRKAERAGIYKPNEPFVNEYCALPIDPTDPGLRVR